MSVENTNARIGTVKNLETGGSYDLLLLGYPDGFPEGRLSFGVDNTPRKITGVQKVVQVFLKALLTTVGSDVMRPTYGTNFNNIALRTNMVLDNSALLSQLTECVASAAAQARRTLNTVGTDPASMIGQVTVIGFQTGKDAIFMAVRVLTIAGVEASVAIPFPELDMR